MPPLSWALLAAEPRPPRRPRGPVRRLLRPPHGVEAPAAPGEFGRYRRGGTRPPGPPRRRTIPTGRRLRAVPRRGRSSARACRARAKSDRSPSDRGASQRWRARRPAPRTSCTTRSPRPALRSPRSAVHEARSFRRTSLYTCRWIPRRPSGGCRTRARHGHAWQKRALVPPYGDHSVFPEGPGSCFMPEVNYVDARVARRSGWTICALGRSRSTGSTSPTPVPVRTGDPCYLGPLPPLDPSST
jgi:hypothetical protein